MVLTRPKPIFENQDDLNKRQLCEECQQDRNLVIQPREIQSNKNNSVNCEETPCSLNYSSRLNNYLERHCSCSVTYGISNTINSSVPFHQSETNEINRNGETHSNCDIYFDKFSDNSFLNCSTHSRSAKHSCYCEGSSEGSDKETMKFFTHEQNPLYQNININDLVLKLMSTDYQNYG